MIDTDFERQTEQPEVEKKCENCAYFSNMLNRGFNGPSLEENRIIGECLNAFVINRFCVDWGTLCYGKYFKPKKR